MSDNELVNTPGGYAAVRKGHVNRWYNHYKFPLIPVVETTEGDDWNSGSFYFSWLCLRAWSLGHFAFEFSLSLDDNGLRVGVVLPYLRIILLLIPFPEFVTDWHYRFMNRDVRVRKASGHE